MSASRRRWIVALVVCVASACESGNVIQPSGAASAGPTPAAPDPDPAAPSPGATATVVVALDSSRLGATHTAHATAIAKDANGTTLSGKTPAWASQDTSIASIDAMTGVVTGLSAGTTLIQATVDGIVASAPLTVIVPTVITAPAPGTGTGSFPNQPGDFAQLRAQTFDSLENSDFYTPGGTYGLASDPTSPEGSASVGEIRFPTGFQSGSAPGNLYARSPFASSSIYISFWVKVSSNWVSPSTSGANKILYINRRGNGGGAVQGSVEFLGLQTLVPSPVMNLVQVTPGAPNEGSSGSVTVAFRPNMASDENSIQAFRGTWNHYEVLMTMNTPGQANGGLKWWWNGVLAGDYTGHVEYSDLTGDAFSEVIWSPTYGGTGDPVPADQYMWMKNLYISGR